eukprot:2919059-Amphidinium_carterae.2
MANDDQHNSRLGQIIYNQDVLQCFSRYVRISVPKGDNVDFHTLLNVAMHYIKARKQAMSENHGFDWAEVGNAHQLKCISSIKTAA